MIVQVSNALSSPVTDKDLRVLYGKFTKYDKEVGRIILGVITMVIESTN